MLNAQRELSRTRDQQFIMAFLDISKAINRVDRTLPCDVLAVDGVPKKFVKANSSLYGDRTVMLKLGEW